MEKSFYPKRLGYNSTSIMPTVFRFDGLRVVIYPNDHRPAHIHVIGAGLEAVFNLNCLVGPVELRENYGFLRQKLARIERVLNEHLEELCRSWEGFHGVA
jgi:hypothetical protein